MPSRANTFRFMALQSVAGRLTSKQLLAAAKSVKLDSLKISNGMVPVNWLLLASKNVS